MQKVSSWGNQKGRSSEHTDEKKVQHLTADVEEGFVVWTEDQHSLEPKPHPEQGPDSLPFREG